jgi:AcrR family transcriptional regulator
MEGTEQANLPASIAAAWGRGARPSRGPKPGLSLERIVQAAIRIAATEGLAAVSMARVAAELGASTMSLYRYVAAKEELLELMADAALGPPPPRDNAQESWRAGLIRWAWAFHARMREHPWGVRIPTSGLPITPHLVAWVEDALQSLRQTGLGEQEKASIVLLLSGYVRGEATLTADLAAGGYLNDERMRGYADVLRMVTDPERFPALQAMLSARVLDTADDPDDEFSFGLECILDGVEALVRRRG